MLYTTLIRWLSTILGAIKRTHAPRYCFVCATRLRQQDFWSLSPLGESLRPWRSDPSVVFQISYANTAGLSEIYNRVLFSSLSSDILIFIHDDVWINDPYWKEKVFESLQSFDVVGVVGNTRISARQPSWAFSSISHGDFVWDTGFLSGSLGHGDHTNGVNNIYGDSKVACELLDGVFFAVKSKTLCKHGVQFDERFYFHFYDLDFCRTARKAGLRMGTWPIALIHQSQAPVGTLSWCDGYEAYLKKWGS